MGKAAEGSCVRDLKDDRTDEQKEEDERGLPHCESCNKALLNGSEQAWMFKGDIGDWMSLELICSSCVTGKKKSHEPLRCECPKCACSEPAVTVLCGFLSCSTCDKEHAVILADPQDEEDED